MNIEKIGGICLVLFIIVAIIITPILSYTTIDNVKITIKDKERINSGSDSYYLIFTENEVFKDDDSFFMFKFDSSDLYSDLEVGKTYNVKVNWVRIPFFSMYRNILEINNEVKNG